MMQPSLLDIVELVVNLTKHNLFMGDQGTIVECYDENHFEVEFINDTGETTALCSLSTQQLIVVWKANTKQWLTTADKMAAMIEHLSEEKRQEVFDFARFIHQRA